MSQELSQFLAIQPHFEGDAIMSDEFANWMSNHTQLSDSSVEKYAGAVRTISKEMSGIGIINKPLSDMSLL